MSTAKPLMLPKITDYLDSQTDAIQRFAAKLGESTHPKEDDLAAIREEDWTRAHESAQQDGGKDGSWVHAYLHQKEGDQGNAAYWCLFAGSLWMRNGSAS